MLLIELIRASGIDRALSTALALAIEEFWAL